MGQTPVHRISEFGHHEHHQDFYVNVLEKHVVSHDFIRVPHKHDFYVCVVFTHGRGTHYIDFKQYKIKPGAVFMMTPGQVHHWELSKDTKGFIFFHSAGFFDLYFSQRRTADFPFYHSLYQDPVVYLRPAALNKLLPLLVMLNAGVEKKPFIKDERTALISLVYIELSGHYRNTVAGTVQAGPGLLYVHKFERLLEKHFREEKSVVFYARETGLSRKHLNRVIKEMLNKTASEMISGRVILEAKRLLINREKTATQVADALGYTDPSYFSRFFKKHTGLNPAEFSKNNF